MADVRSLVQTLRAQNSDLLRTLSRKSTLVLKHDSLKHDTLESVDKHDIEPRLFNKHRVHRRHSQLKKRPQPIMQDDSDTLTVPLALPSQANCPPARTVHDILRPASSLTVACHCEPCKSLPDFTRQVDALWKAGEHDKAASLDPPVCELKLKSEPLLLRPQRPWIPKTVTWESPADHATPSERRDEFRYCKYMSLRKSLTDRYEDWRQYEAEIERVEREIHRQIGAADWPAEVVVIVSTLRVSLNAYAAGCRIVRFFEAKGVDHVLIDINADIGTDSLDYRLVRKWLDDGRLYRDPHKVACGVSMCALAPQVLVDGVPLGTFEDVLTLEDENDLDYILGRQACPNCLRDRETTSTPLGPQNHCRLCGAKFTQLITRDYLNEEELMLLLQANALNASRIKAPTPRDFERRRRELGFKRVDEDMAEWFTPDKLAQFGAPSVGFEVEFE